jgi:hypothetical protein
VAACGLLATGGSVAAGTSAAGPASTVDIRSGVLGHRYCELLIVHRSRSRLFYADVYNTFGLNDCPPAAWKAIDTTAVAKAQHAIVTVRNGPRFWLMDQIAKHRQGTRMIKNLGGVRMIEEATVSLAQLSAAPYTVHRVNRSTVFTYSAGRTIYQLRAPDRSLWVMQSWSRQIDPNLGRAQLAMLGTRLRLPAGWAYRPRRLSRPLRIVTVRAAAEVLQDNLDNTYSRLPG